MARDPFRIFLFMEHSRLLREPLCSVPMLACLSEGGNQRGQPAGPIKHGATMLAACSWLLWKVPPWHDDVTHFLSCSLYVMETIGKDWTLGPKQNKWVTVAGQWGWARVHQLARLFNLFFSSICVLDFSSCEPLGGNKWFRIWRTPNLIPSKVW